MYLKSVGLAALGVLWAAPALAQVAILQIRVIEGEGAVHLPGSRSSRPITVEITDDQTWVNEVGRPLGLDEESLRHHPMRHVLTMAIGASAPLTINHYRVPLATGNLVLICSDGLHGVLEAPQMEQILDGGRSGASLQESCQNLVEAAKQAGGPDNVTVVLMRKIG